MMANDIPSAPSKRKKHEKHRAQRDRLRASQALVYFEKSAATKLRQPVQAEIFQGTR